MHQTSANRSFSTSRDRGFVVHPLIVRLIGDKPVFYSYVLIDDFLWATPLGLKITYHCQPPDKSGGYAQSSPTGF